MKKSDATTKYVNAVITKRLGAHSQRRKFIDIKMNYDNVHCQLRIGVDLLLISENTWKKNIDKTKLTHIKKGKKIIIQR